MPIQPPYTTGTATVTAGSAVVAGTTTAWALGLVSGGLFTRQGLAVPILSVESNTSLTLAYPWPGASGTGAYAIDLGRADAASAIVANRRLADVLNGLVGMSPFGAQLTAAETAAAVRTLIEAQALLGFVPVQQGGGAGQNSSASNKIRVGWSNVSLKAQVDNFDIGRIWSDHEAARSLQLASGGGGGGNGYQKFPGGLIFQWGVIRASQTYVPFNIAFPTGVMHVHAMNVGGAGVEGVVRLTTLDQPTAAGVNIRQWDFSGTSWTIFERSVQWFAIGY